MGMLLHRTLMEIEASQNARQNAEAVKPVDKPTTKQKPKTVKKGK